MEAGNRCFDQRVPEETNRKIVDHTADINLPIAILLENTTGRGIPADRLSKLAALCLRLLITISHLSMRQIY